MKKLTLTLFSLLLYFSSFTQPYQSFFGSEKTEYAILRYITCYQDDTDDISLKKVCVCCDTDEISFQSSDTITINGILYYEVSYFSYFDDPYIKIREDTTTGRVYRYLQDLDEEILTCDMSLNVGDTFKLFNSFVNYAPVYQPYFFSDCSNGNDNYCHLIVDSIAYINGRKVIYFPYLEFSHFFYGYHYYEDYSDAVSLRFIEGIGPTYGPVGYYPYTQEKFLGLLLCVHKDDSLTFMLHEDFGCYQLEVSIPEYNKDKIRIYPNPAYDKINVVLDSSWDDAVEIILYDMVGCVVYRKTVTTFPVEVDISKFSTGVYNVTIQGNKDRYSSKFIKMKQ